MPIKPENMALYPGGSIRSPEWLAIRERIRNRAGDKCEQCGVANGAWGWRDRDGIFHLADQSAGDLNEGICIRIVCTTAHVDGKLTDHSDDNLRFWCQRCHNRHDAPSRRVNAAITIHDRKAGTPDMFRGKA